MNIGLTEIFLFGIIIVTGFAIIDGIKDALSQIKEIKSGKTLEEINKAREEEKRKKIEKQEKKFDSKIYRWTHPIEYLELKAEKKIKASIGGKKKNAKNV